MTRILDASTTLGCVLGVVGVVALVGGLAFVLLTALERRRRRGELP